MTAPTPTQLLQAFTEVMGQAGRATPGDWKIRQGRSEDQFFIQAPRLSPDDPYDIEVLGEDDTLYPTRRADAEAIVGLVNFVRTNGPAVAQALKLMAALSAPSSSLRHAMISAYEDASDDRLPDGDGKDHEIVQQMLAAAVAAASEEPLKPMVSVQQAWLACGGNPGIQASVQELLEALQAMNEAEDAVEVEMPNWRSPEAAPECKLEGEWGPYARVLVQCANGERHKAVFDPLTHQFQVPFDGNEIAGVVGWIPEDEVVSLPMPPAAPGPSKPRSP